MVIKQMFLDRLSTITTSFELKSPLYHWKRDFADSAKFRKHAGLYRIPKLSLY